MAEAAAANYPSSNRSWEVGGSTSTVRGWRVAETLLNLIRMDHDGRTTTFETMTIDEIDDEFLRLLITRVITFFSTNVIPANWKIVNGEMVPRNEDNTNILTGERLVQYIGRMIAIIRKRFPSHPDFAGLDPKQANAVPTWWTATSASAVTCINKFHQHVGGNYSFGQKNCRHIYPFNDECEVGKALVDVWASKCLRLCESLLLLH